MFDGPSLHCASCRIYQRWRMERMRRMLLFECEIELGWTLLGSDLHEKQNCVPSGGQGSELSLHCRAFGLLSCRMSGLELQDDVKRSIMALVLRQPHIPAEVLVMKQIEMQKLGRQRWHLLLLTADRSFTSSLALVIGNKSGWRLLCLTWLVVLTRHRGECRKGHF